MTKSNMEIKPELRLTPDDIRHASLPLAERGGYEIAAVGHVLAAAADQLAAAQTEILRLKAEAQRSTQGVKLAVGAETVNLLSRAQVLADKHVSDAEQYAKDLIVTARNQYSEILKRAEVNVAAKAVPVEAAKAAAVEPAPAAAGQAASPDTRASLQDIEYVRTYTKVAQVQLRAVIDALAEQVDQLGQLPVYNGVAPETARAGN